jgi:putative ABC transport system permease protein
VPRLSTGGGLTFVELMQDVIVSLRTLGKRSVLALLGIAIGSSSVVAMINIGSNASGDAAKIFKDMGVDTLVAQVAEIPGHRAPALLTLDTVQLHQQVPGLLNIAPVAQAGGAVIFKGHTLDADLVGSTSELAGAMGLKLGEGRFLSDFDKAQTYVVIGHSLAAALAAAGGELRLGERLRINHYLFQVIGILREQPASMLMPVRANDSLFISIEGMRRINASAQIGEVIVRVAAHRDMNDVALALVGALQQASGNREVSMLVPQQIMDGMSRQNRTFAWLLAALGSISLIGGGVGVMNVMLMNVTQRRREIGIRMALGARRRDVRNLFMLEALTLAALGAFCGAMAGLLCAYIYAHFSGWNFSLAPMSLPLGIGSTLLVGLFFGLYPAILASRLQPVEALRDE